jgi:hypothetical protein
VPHSNFHPALEFDKDGHLHIGGPLEEIEKDVARVVISAYVSQPPRARYKGHAKNADAEPEQGVSCANSVKLEGASLKKANQKGEWGFSATVHDGPFRPGWAWAEAELVELGKNGGIETYTWSQWVDIRP